MVLLGGDIGLAMLAATVLGAYADSPASTTNRGVMDASTREAYDLYQRAWNEPERALALLEECWAPDGVYADDEVPDGVVWRAALVDLIAATHESLPGFRVWETSPRDCSPVVLGSPGPRKAATRVSRWPGPMSSSSPPTGASVA